MIREYIEKLYSDNNKELNKLEKQMKSLFDDLTYLKDWHDTLQKESNMQTNIFSPRSINDNVEENLEESKNKIEKINQQIEYTREMMETHLKKKDEYEKLLNEIEKNEKDDSERTENKNPAGNEINIEELKELLNEIYRKSEICLALLNSNKNRCKVELNDIKRMIKKFAEDYKG